MDHGIFQIIASDGRRLEAYVKAYNEIYPTLYKFACSVNDSIWNRERQDELKFTIYACVSTALVRIEPRFAHPLLYHIISDIGLQLRNTTLIYVFMRTWEDMNHVI